MPPSPSYRASTVGPGFCLRQGEILSDVPQFRFDVATLGTATPFGEPMYHPYAVILSQDCDLDQDFNVRQKQIVSDKLLPSVLFCEVATAEELFSRVKALGSKLWDRIRINKDERYHFLQKAEADSDALGQGMPELGIDFKRYFAISTDEIYKRVEMGEAKRRCVLVSPYLEHLSSRFAYFLSRVALPQDHASQ
ncbi:MAG: hypothetical protein ACRELF_00090 [Gemmataceae bacterium]